MNRVLWSILLLAFVAALGSVPSADQQTMQGYPMWTPDKPGSDNISVVAHVPLGPPRPPRKGLKQAVLLL